MFPENNRVTLFVSDPIKPHEFLKRTFFLHFADINMEFLLFNLGINKENFVI